MFKITSKQPINWDRVSFALAKGDNEFPSKQSVPAELWPKLERFRSLGIVDFEGDAKAGGDKVVLEQMTERHLYAMSKDELAALAESNKISVTAAEPAVGVKKKDLLEALVAKLPKAPELEKTEAEAPPVAPSKVSKKPASAGPVTVE